MKKLLAFSLAIVFLFSLVGCSSSEKFLDYDLATPSEPLYRAETEEAPFGMYYGNKGESISNIQTSENQSSAGRKRIRTFDLTVETLEYEKFLDTLQQEVVNNGGYIENSNISGNSYNYTSNRYANFTCRIPSKNVDAFISMMNGLGNVTSKNEKETDVTLNYVDTEARIASLQTEYDRLLELLGEAENLDTVILLEERLTEVRYELESYQSQLRTYDNLVDYSTVTISVNEVKRATVTETKTVWEKISSEFSDNVYDIWTDMQDFFIWFVSNIPYFLIWGVIILIIVLIVRRILRNNKQYQTKKAYRKAQKEKRKAEKLAKKNGTALPEEPLKKEE